MSSKGDGLNRNAIVGIAVAATITVAAVVVAAAIGGNGGDNALAGWAQYPGCLPNSPPHYCPPGS